MSMFTRLTVQVGQCALVYRDGKVERVLPPGRHRLFGEVTTAFVEMRERLFALSPQEVLTADAVALRVTAALRVAVTDPVTFTENAADPVSAVYLAVQIALRDHVSGATVEDVMRRNDRIDGAALLAAAQAAGARNGIEVREVFVKDVIVSSEIRSAAMELVTAKARGAARLEAARAETAALRALANAGRMLDAYPALAQLKLIQAVPYGSRVTLSVRDTGAPTESDPDE
ncbi:slipin family protein [Mycolicibacterium komossense]|uniref:Slipin family protein n=1 Tax=Mycolicibacterium komossense TaxID=1779 RepID=A0ABT3CLF6_9MYCO|nr:slipin family protein [Mycolicibacterium komossense]MCV7230178.1 slipin family protein [Mycolicibacterium komossense]